MDMVVSNLRALCVFLENCRISEGDQRRLEALRCRIHSNESSTQVWRTPNPHSPRSLLSRMAQTTSGVGTSTSNSPGNRAGRQDRNLSLSTNNTGGIPSWQEHLLTGAGGPSKSETTGNRIDLAHQAAAGSTQRTTQTNHRKSSRFIPALNPDLVIAEVADEEEG